jgi:hypothetical protein
MYNMDLNLEILDDIEAPLSDSFWTGFGIGAGVVLGIAAIVAT